MYVCMYACMHSSMYACKCTCMYAFIHTSVKKLLWRFDPVYVKLLAFRSSAKTLTLRTRAALKLRPLPESYLELPVRILSVCMYVCPYICIWASMCRNFVILNKYCAGVFVSQSSRCTKPPGCSFIHSFIHTYIHTYIHTCIHKHIHTYIHTYIQCHSFQATEHG